MRILSARWWIWIWLCSCLCLQAAPARILKVLPHYLDLEGRESLSPSLYERDAYQFYLRQHPEKRSALRFVVNWKAKHLRSEKLLLRIELKNSGGDIAQPVVLERPVRPGRLFSAWSSLVLEGADYHSFGQLLAWRASLWKGDQLLAEQKSFLW
jgi:hypothetical protein